MTLKGRICLFNRLLSSLIFYREVFWYRSMLPAILNTLNRQQQIHLLRVMPRLLLFVSSIVSMCSKLSTRTLHAECNYQDVSLKDDFCFRWRYFQVLSVLFVCRHPYLCLPCNFLMKPREEGMLIMENLKEGQEEGRFLDMKEVERAGTTPNHMKLILEGKNN